jgi:low affinity Fe/Cu permease
MNKLFSAIAAGAARQAGRARTFVAACLIIVVWAVSGFLFHWSDTWQLVINTGTTVVTFLMVFLLQNTQTRDTLAIQLKLDELIRATKDARNVMIDLEDASDDRLAEVKTQFDKAAKKAGRRP